MTNTSKNKTIRLLPSTAREYCCLILKITKATNKVIQVDGWTDPCEEHRMCLGFRGFINTTHEIETIRRAIGNGIELRLGNIFSVK